MLREPVGKAFGVQAWQNISFVSLYSYSDVLLAENMEGRPPRYNFSA